MSNLVVIGISNQFYNSMVDLGLRQLAKRQTDLQSAACLDNAYFSSPLEIADIKYIILVYQIIYLFQSLLTPSNTTFTNQIL